MSIVPCTILDLRARGSVMTAGFIIDARLGAKNLEQSLSTLVEHKFPGAGARLARRNGAYEFQIPRTFDAETPPIAFTVDNYPEPYRSATRPKLPMHLPDCFDATQPSVHPVPELDVYFKSRKCPTAFDGFLLPNTPILHVHVAAFDDFTFIGLTWSHIAFDGLGMQALLYAWTRLLSGDAINTIPGMDWDAQPFEAFTRTTAVTRPRGWFEPARVGWWQRLVRSLMRIMWGPREATPTQARQDVTHIVRMPKLFLDEAKREINNNLKLQGSKEWVGSSDVLTAWCFRSINDTTPIHIHLHVDLRDYCIFPGSSSIATPYIRNAIWTIPVVVPANAFGTEPLAELALRIRRAIKAYNADLDRIESDLRWFFANPGTRLAPWPPGAEFAVQSNLLKGRAGEFNFSGACERKASVAFLLVETMGGGKKVEWRGVGEVLMEDKDAVWMTQGGWLQDWESIRQSGTLAFV
ncbi:hypothetical protein B0H17DRAFT_937455 [Mycena rosella]|uniref:Uncharacterized protein n=1 Tax=Mycena rosella TaxID=1033263 RepID=A0AAD7GHI6_MYCRO|nr:hypothetical protein B0H17DRAFT_937455 [Mycena rosella]